MSTITIPIHEARLERLKELASRAGLTPEQLAGASLEEWLENPDSDFERAAQYVLDKNAELYRRLS